MEKRLVAQRVANKLYSTERSIDAAMTEAAEMMAELMQARRDVKASAVVGNEAQVKLAEAIIALSSARSAMVACHSELDQTRLRIGIRTKMVGPDDDKDEQIARRDEAAVLRQVV